MNSRILNVNEREFEDYTNGIFLFPLVFRKYEKELSNILLADDRIKISHELIIRLIGDAEYGEYEELHKFKYDD